MAANSQVLASSEAVSSYVTTGTAREVTFRESEARVHETERWNATVDTLLGWLREAVARGGDGPSYASIESAIDLAMDLREMRSVPTSVALTDEGGISFEWRFSDETVTLEVVASGLAELTRFRNGRVVQEAILQRNPRTRRLELRGPTEA